MKEPQWRDARKGYVEVIEKRCQLGEIGPGEVTKVKTYLEKTKSWDNSWASEITEEMVMEIKFGRLFKQIIGFPLGILLATSWGFGAKLYNSLAHQPICKISSPEKNSFGYFYKWTVKIKDKNQGGFLLYPKDDALIMLSSIKRPPRITEAHNIGEHKNGDFSRGIKFIYTEGNEPLRLL